MLIMISSISTVGLVLWMGLDAVMRGVTEIERNIGGSRQVVKNDRMRPQYD